ncbi:MAG: MFS transporter [Planctomycetota bacterium]|nr:MFS transporter [Planctomycetota bacterium]
MNLKENRLLRTAMLCLLYFAQGFPYGFVMYALIAIFIEGGFTRAETVLISGFAVLPWSFKFLWAPMIDSIRWPALGLRRPWIAFAQLGMAVTLLATDRIGTIGTLHQDATVELSPWLAQFFSWIPDSDVAEGATSISAILFVGGIFFLHNCFASLQDVATDALAVDILEEEERGRVNGFMWGSKIFGISVGTYGGAVMVEAYGMNATIQAQAMMVLVILVAVVLMRERAGEKRFPWSKGQAVSSQIAALRSPVVVLEELLRALALWTTAIGVLVAILTSVCQGVFINLAADTFVNVFDWTATDYSKAQGSYGVGGEVIGALTGGFFCDRFGRRKMAFIGGLIASGSLIVFGLLHPYWLDDSFSPLWVIPLFKGAIAFQTVSLFSLYMKISWTTAAATQFTLYMAVSNFGTFIGTQLNKLDWQAWQLFVLGGASALIPILLLLTMRPELVVARRLKDEKST